MRELTDREIALFDSHGRIPDLHSPVRRQAPVAAATSAQFNRKRTAAPMPAATKKRGFGRPRPRAGFLTA